MYKTYVLGSFGSAPDSMLLRPLSNVPEEQELPADSHLGTPKELSKAASCGPFSDKVGSFVGK